MGTPPRVRVEPAGDVSISQILSPAGAISLFNGNTFAEIGRALATALFADLKFQRRKEASSAVAHFITGVLEEEMMLAAIESLCQSTNFTVGDRV